MKRTNNKGFTFIELVLYIGILSVFMVAVTTLIGTVVSSNRKMTARKKIQNQANETYDTISDMLMGATDVQIYGDAYIGTTTSSAIQADSVFVTPAKGEAVVSNVVQQATASGPRYVNLATVTGGVAGAPTKITTCYDMSKIVSYGSTATTNKETYITAGTSNKKLMMKINYASGLDASGNEIITSCTLVYNADDKKIYMYKQQSNETDAEKPDQTYFVDASGNASSVLCKDVKNFKLQINQEENSFAITLELEDSLTATSYEVNGVVNIRNTNVLQAGK